MVHSLKGVQNNDLSDLGRGLTQALAPTRISVISSPLRFRVSRSQFSLVPPSVSPLLFVVPHVEDGVAPVTSSSCVFCLISFFGFNRQPWWDDGRESRRFSDVSQAGL